MHQASFRLRVDRHDGESIRAHAWRQQRLNSTPNTVRHPDPFAALLKRQADEVMRAVTECPPLAVPANVARLRDLEQVILHAGIEAIQQQNEALAALVALRNGGGQ